MESTVETVPDTEPQPEIEPDPDPELEVVNMIICCVHSFLDYCCISGSRFVYRTHSLLERNIYSVSDVFGMPRIRDIHKTQRVSCKNCGVNCSLCCNIYFGLVSRHAYVTYPLPSNSCAGREGGFSMG